MKYGVISTEDLAEDLKTWRWLYISGRLQKPVIILSKQNYKIQDLLKKNLRSAALAGLLLINSNQCTEEDLYRSITEISYTGIIYTSK